MKKIISYICSILIIIGCISLIFVLNDNNVNNNINNIVNNEDNSSNKKDYSNLKSAIYYQIKVSDNTSYRFLVALGGLEKDLYNDINYVEWELYDNENTELLSTLKVYDYYLGVSVINDDGTEEVITATDLGYDVIYVYDSILSLEKEYKIVANIYNQSGLFYRCSRIITT